MSLSKAIGVIGGINECVNLFQSVRSAISALRSQWNTTQEHKLQDDDVLQLQSGLCSLGETLPAMYGLIDRVERKIHECSVEELLSKLKDAVYDAEDLLDEFRWYEMKVVVDGNATELSPFIDFFHSVTHGKFNKVTDIRKRLNCLSGRLEKLGLLEASPRFNKSVRPETTSLLTEPKIFGREEELDKVITLLGVPEYSSKDHCKRKRTSSALVVSASNQVSVIIDTNEATIKSIPVLPIVGIGGVGKTTLAQNICNHTRVKSYFNLIIWICVSDDFDVKRLTKEAIQSSSGREATTDHLDSLQHIVTNNVNKRRVLLVLDDMWEDALNENGQCWKRFCAPFTNVLQGSMMLVTTRSQKVADLVRTMDPFPLEGLKNDVLWDFFKFCVFGSDDCNIDPELDSIGRSILLKLKGSPLAAKTLGRLLGMCLDNRHWNNILKSELWELRQNETDILPALRLSYLYLPFHLKRCFSFCAVYPKDYKFEVGSLSEIWVAEGFVAPQGNIPLQDIGRMYFEDLVNRSFFQNHDGTHVIHDLIHDMAQLVSKGECFIINNTSDFQRIPENVRHLSIHTSGFVNWSNLLSLCGYKKLRTLICSNSSYNISASLMDCWCRKLRRMRVISAFISEQLPESIGNMKHLRYFRVSGNSPLKTLPSALCSLYNLQILYAINGEFDSMPKDFSNLINLHKFESQVLQYHRGLATKVDAAAPEGLGKHIKLIQNFNQFCGHLVICNLGMISKDRAAEAELEKKENLDSLTLQWSSLPSQYDNDIEVLQALRPFHTNLSSLCLEGYPGESLPSWFQPENFQSNDCNGFQRISQHINLNEIPLVLVDNSKDRTDRIFSSLTDLTIERCSKLSSLKQFLQPAFLPVIKKIKIGNCERLVSLPTAWFGDFRCLEELMVSHCPSLNSRGLLLVPSLKKLELVKSGILADDINCCSLTYLFLSCSDLTSIQLQMWSLPALQQLTITKCDSLTFIRAPESIPRSSGGSSIVALSSLTDLTIFYCKKLLTLDDLITHEYLPAIERIHVNSCQELQSLPGERFGSFPFLKALHIGGCPCLDWQSGMVLPSSLQKLSLHNCGDFSAWFPKCLENLTCLESLEMISCERIVSIPGHMWSSHLTSLRELRIWYCLDLESIGGPNKIKNIKEVTINGCPKLKRLKQPVRRCGF